MKLIFLIFFVCISFNLYGKTGSVTGLEIPRFVSLKSNDVNLRVGPSTNYPIKLKYITQNLPVEIIDEFDVWRQGRDHNGKIGWLHKSLIKGERFILTGYKNENEINLLFDNKTFNLIGWQTKDIYQNVNITYLTSIQINQNVDKNLFKLPIQN